STRSPKIRVGIAPAEDRWITLTDGSRVYQGLEVSYLLGHKLLQSGQFNPIFLNSPIGMPGIVAEAGSSDLNFRGNEPWNQIPEEWTAWAKVQSVSSGIHTAASKVSSTAVPVSVVIKPVVETLLYSSGERSDRMVYGFAPGRENPFNAGRVGSL